MYQRPAATEYIRSGTLVRYYMIIMFLTRKPSDQEINSFISAQRLKPFSYSPLEITRHSTVARYNIDHYRIQLGSGLQTYRAAVSAIRGWKMFEIGWLHLFWDKAAIEPGTTVAVVVKHLGFWSMNGCRIVYVVEEEGAQERYGFAYGTLGEHAERGEERFMVEWNKEDGTVWYDILAISKPGLMAMLAYPYARSMQKRFARDSKRAMKRAVEKAGV